MGWFRRAFKPRVFAPTAYPFAGEGRMYHGDYERLATGWWKVAVGSPQEWEAKLAGMGQGVRGPLREGVTKEGERAGRGGASVRAAPRFRETRRTVSPSLSTTMCP